MYVLHYAMSTHVLLILLVFVFYVFGLKYEYDYSEQDFEDSMEYIKNDGVYYSLNSILDFFHQGEFRDLAGVKELMQRYQETIKMWEDKANSGRTPRIFIVVEGLNIHNRKVSAQILARKLGGQFVLASTARGGLKPILDNTQARKAFHALNKYATANKVRLVSLYQPVIMQRYWFDHATFIMAKRFTDRNLPLANSSIYKFPEDLLKPNITFFINDMNEDKMSKTQIKFARRLVTVYRRMRDPSVTEIICPGPPHLIVEKMIAVINEYDANIKEIKHSSEDYDDSDSES